MRRGDSLSPLLFNVVMDKIIKQIRKLKRYKMGYEDIRILCYLDDAVLITENENTSLI